MRQIFAYRGPTTNSDGQTTVNASQHFRAVETGTTNEFGRAMIRLLAGWEEYAEAHQKRYECQIGEDYVLGPYWAEVGLAIKRLLDGDVGGLDCGSISHNITSAIEAQGFKTDGYNLIDDE